jgi:hypothetical protein
MAYADGEALILNRIQQLPGFGVANATRADWTVLNSGKSDHYAILRRGRMARRDWLTPVTYRASWLTVIEVWQKVLPNQAETRTRLFEHVETIMRLLEYPRLSDDAGTIEDSDIPEIGEPEEMWTRDGGPVYLRVQLEMVWNEQREIAYAE